MNYIANLLTEDHITIAYARGCIVIQMVILQSFCKGVQYVAITSTECCTVIARTNNGIIIHLANDYIVDPSAKDCIANLSIEGCIANPSGVCVCHVL